MKSNLELFSIAVPSDTDEKYFLYDVQAWSSPCYPIPREGFVVDRYIKRDKKVVSVELSPSYIERYWFLREYK